MTNPTNEQLLELARRHELALSLEKADPGFHLSNDDMRMIVYALRFAAGPEQLPPAIEDALAPHYGWKEQSFEYYAAHFLVGCGLTRGDLHGHLKGLAHELKKQYDIGVEHGRAASEGSPAYIKSGPSR